ncbi:MAG TPA: hypothetical protein VMC08_04695, partial [Bacteroidales bacterium]|nr:hypothetical protein [Bacteroidales bacterium]
MVWIVLLAALTGLQAARAQDPLPSWNETPAKKAILQYVEAVTTPGSPDYISPPDRIATFDQDGTLVTEMPLSLEAYFMVASVK